KERVVEVATALGLLQVRSGDNIACSRHPLADLVEAADDICYTIIDFEDGITLGPTNEESALEHHMHLVKDSINTSKYHTLNNTADRLSYLRALAINTLITEAVELFLENEDAILNGNFHYSLFDKSRYEAQIKDIIKLSIERIYQSEEVINKEIAGYKMLSHLLDTYTRAFLPEENLKDSNFDYLVRKSVPIPEIPEEQSVYKTLLQICSFTASLTDGNTVASFEKYKG